MNEKDLKKSRKEIKYIVDKSLEPINYSNKGE
jgi:hypothetical protein